MENEYNLELEVPNRFDLIRLLDLPPNYILSKHEMTYQTGVLGQVPHAVYDKNVYNARMIKHKLCIFAFFTERL